MAFHPDAPPLVQHLRDPLPTPAAIWFGVAAAPLAWSVQGLIGWWISAQVCADGTPQWGSWSAGQVRTLLVALSGAALVIAASAIVASYRGWQARRQPGQPAEAFASDFRVAFMAMAGMLIASVFSVAIVLTGLAVGTVSVCESMR